MLYLQIFTWTISFLSYNHFVRYSQVMKKKTARKINFLEVAWPYGTCN